jgi:hypothetical protein
MKKQITVIMSLVFILLMISSLPVCAAVKEIIAEGSYNMGDGETPVAAEE